MTCKRPGKLVVCPKDKEKPKSTSLQEEIEKGNWEKKRTCVVTVLLECCSFTVKLVTLDWWNNDDKVQSVAVGVAGSDRVD
jgi:hypothetical protein